MGLLLLSQSRFWPDGLQPVHAMHLSEQAVL